MKLLKYDPSQPRDDNGRWTAVDGLVQVTEGQAYQQVQSFLDSVNPTIIKKFNDVRAQIKNGTPTTSLKVNGEWTPERQKLHEKIIDSFFDKKKPVKNPELIFTGGIPGSGKSSILDGRIKNHVLVDSDEIKKQLPEYKGWNAPLVHDESTELAQRVFDRAVQDGYNIVNDGTLRSRRLTEELLQAATDAGYRSKLIFVDTSIPNALKRMVSRFEKTGRFIDPAFLGVVDGNPVRVFKTLRNRFNSYELWDNNSDKPKLVEES
jgi:predicted ABC-type ATPase